MPKTILITILTLSLGAVFTLAATASERSSGEVFGFSSEESEGVSYLGVDTRDITADRLGPLHLKEETGVEVTMVDQDAPAGKAGLKEQDVILTLNGEKIRSVEQLRRVIRETPPGRIISLGITRNGQPMTIKVQLADRKNGYADSYHPDGKSFHFTMPAMPAIPEIPAMPDLDIPVSIVVVHSSARSGLMVENLTPQLGDYFGVKNGEGVLVRSVERGSRAEKAGFRAGDVITKINDEPIHDAGDFTHALRSRKDNTLSIGIVRDKKEQTVILPLPERKQSRDTAESREQLNTYLNQVKAEMSRLNALEAAAMARLGPEIQQEVEWQYKKALEDVKQRMNQMRKDGDQLRLEQNEREMERALHRLEDELQGKNWE
jgi:serine protease Do